MSYDGRFVYASHTPGRPPLRVFREVTINGYGEAITLDELGPVVYSSETRSTTTATRRTPPPLPRTTLPTFHAAALLGSEQHKWLLVLSNGTYSQEDERVATDHRESVSDQRGRTTRRESDDFNSRRTDDQNTTARFRLVGIGGDESRAGALGLFGAYRRKASDTEERFRSQSLRTTSISGEQDVTRRAVRERLNENSRRDYLLGGLEYDATAPGWDWINVLTYQKTLSDLDIEQERRRVRVDSARINYDELRTFRETNTAEETIEGTSHPNLLRASSYYRRQLSWLAERDYAFVSLTGRYGFGDFDYNFREMERSRDVRRLPTPNGDSITVRGDSSLQAGEAQKDVRAWRARGAAGYAVRKRAEDLRVFAGAGLSAAYGESENAAPSLRDGSTDALDATEASDLRAALTLPAYLRYAISERLALFAGGQYVYAFERQTLELTEPPLDENQSRNTETSQRTERERTAWHLTSDSSIYAGLFAEHETGLFVEASFGARLLDASQWSVALGYRF